MNLTITSSFYPAKNTKPQNTQDRSVLHPNLNGLNADTISFSGKQKQIKTATNTLKELVINDYEKNKAPHYHILSNKFMDTLEAVANKLKEFGISFDRTYCEQNPIKKSDSYYSKFLRSGATPSDQIRATLYMENPYDMKLLNDKLLPELKIRGYNINIIPDEIVGKRVKSKKPDFDIRLADITEKDIQDLDENLRKCISHPQKSGYEDIQMRLVDTLTPKRNRPPHELLILFGKNYAEAKHNESYYVYNIIRTLKNELNIARVQNPELHSPAKRVQDNIKIISGQLINSISRPLFINAKNLDFYKEKFQLPVELSKATGNALTGLVEGIRSKIPIHYRAELAKVSSDDYKPELERLVKASQEYKIREDKNIYVKDLLEMKADIIKQIKNHRTNDLKLIRDVQTRLSQTIEKYVKKD